MTTERVHVLKISVRASGAGIKMEGLLYLEKYGIGGPEFAGITKRRISNRRGKAALPCPGMNWEACWVQLGH